MTLAEAVRSCFRNYVKFSGRASRSEFWWFALVVFACSLVSLALVETFGLPGKVLLFWLLLLFPLVSVGYRRLHDVDLEGHLFPFALVSIAVPVRLLAAPVNLSEHVKLDLSLVSGPPLTWLAILFAHMAAGLLIIRQMILPSDPETNHFGPNPNEVPQ